MPHEPHMFAVDHVLFTQEDVRCLDTRSSESQVSDRNECRTLCSIIARALLAGNLVRGWLKNHRLALQQN